MILNRWTKTTPWITALILTPSSNLGPGFSSQVSWIRPRWYLTCNGCGQALLLPGHCVILQPTLTLIRAATLSPCSLKFLLIPSLLSSFHHHPPTATLPCPSPPLLVSLSPDKLRGSLALQACLYSALDANPTKILVFSQSPCCTVSIS